MTARSLRPPRGSGRGSSVGENVEFGGSVSASPCALRKRHDPRGGRVAGVPDLDRACFAVLAVRTTPARFRRKRKVRDLSLALVAAPAALDENGDGASDHASKRTLRHNVLSKGRLQALYEMIAFMKFTRGRILFIAGLVALFVAYTLFGFFGVPRLLRSQATEFVSDRYQRKLDIGEIHFNPFTLELRIDTLSFPDSQGEPARRVRAPARQPQCFVGVQAGARVSSPSSSASRSRMSSSARTAL